MITFKAHSDLSKLDPTDPAHPIIQKLLDTLITEAEKIGYNYNPEHDGYILLVEKSDTDRVLHEIWPDRMLVDVPWEGVSKQGDHYVAVYLADNQFGLVFVIPDTGRLSDSLVDGLEDNLVPEL